MERLDRTVHAKGPQMEVVRYDRAGKWYLEPTNRTLPRQHVTVNEAAHYTRWLLGEHGVHLPGLPGGTAYDRLVLKGRA